jgi:tetratricopeptide (TPR) repeat protein
MGLFQAGAGYDRQRILEEAARARARKKRAKAIELYRWVLALEPQNVELHGKLAPLLAESGHSFDAWCSFRNLARACLREGQTDRALAVYREAALYLPREVEAWLGVARLQHKDGQPRQALETLVEGSRNFRTRWLRPQAIHLLRRAREIDPWDFEVATELAQLLASTHQRQEGRYLLAGLAERCSGERLRRVRTEQLRLSPGPRSLWRWLSEALRPSGERLHDVAASGRGSSVVPLRTARRA